MLQHAKQCYKLERLRQKRREGEIAAAKEARYREFVHVYNTPSAPLTIHRVETRLLAEGYVAVDIGDDDVRKHKDVALPKQMTDRGASSSILSNLESDRILQYGPAWVQ